jgi:hypothetical protein
MAVRRIRVPARELSPELLDAVRAIAATNDVPAEDVEVDIVSPADAPLRDRVLALLGTPREGPVFEQQYQGMFIEADRVPEHPELTPQQQAILRRQREAMFGRRYGRSGRDFSVSSPPLTEEEGRALSNTLVDSLRTPPVLRRPHLHV